MRENAVPFVFCHSQRHGRDSMLSRKIYNSSSVFVGWRSMQRRAHDHTQHHSSYKHFHHRRCRRGHNLCSRTAKLESFEPAPELGCLWVRSLPPVPPCKSEIDNLSQESLVGSSEAMIPMCTLWKSQFWGSCAANGLAVHIVGQSWSCSGSWTRVSPA